MKIKDLQLTEASRPKMEVPGIKFTVPSAQRDSLEKALRELRLFVEQKGSDDGGYSIAVSADRVKDLAAVTRDVRKAMGDYPHSLKVEWFDLVEPD